MGMDIWTIVKIFILRGIYMDKRKNNYLISIMTILIIPIQYLLVKLIGIIGLEEGSANYILAYTIISYLICIIVIILNRELLKNDFSKFKEKIWTNILLAIVLVFVMHGILYLVRIPLKNLSGTEIEEISNLPLYLTIFSTTIPLTAPFVEELVFRYHLLGIFENRAIKFIMFFVSAIIFGLIHYNNFQGNLIQLIPYMVMGMVFNLIYLYYKNIWNSITVHLIFNGVNVVVGIFSIIILQFI